jgi:hypothetical protein
MSANLVKFLELNAFILFVVLEDLLKHGIDVTTPLSHELLPLKQELSAEIKLFFQK